MSEKVTSKRQKIIYYSILAVMLALIAAVTVIAIVQSEKGDISIDNPTSSDGLNDGNSGGKPSDSGSSGKGDGKTDPTPEKPDDKPVAEVISFITPVQGGTIFKEYTENSVVYSSTLGVYTGHMGIDFKGAEGANVLAAYKGTVKEITTGYLQGTTVKIEHGNGLVTVYNSIEPAESLTVGQEVKQGDVIGKISDNNKQENKDGAHLHFEVFENGTTISPLKYLTIEEK